MASIQKIILAVFLSSLDGAIKLCIDFLGHLCKSFVEIARPFILVEVEISKSLAGILKLMANLSHSLHIGIHFYAETTAEDVDKFDGRSSGAATKPPYIGIHDIHALNNGSQHSCKTITGSAMCMEIDRNFHRSLKLRHQRIDTRGAHESGHIL